MKIKETIEDLMEFIMDALPILIIIGIMMSLILGLGFLEGRAKASWIEQTKGVEIPWWEAAFLDVDVNTTDADIRLSQ